MPSLQAVIFDLDGTLIDTVPGIARAVNDVLQTADCPPVAVERVAGMVGDGVRVLLERAFAAGGRVVGAGELDRHAIRLSALLEADPPTPSDVFPAVSDVLQQLDEDGVALGVCTNKPESPARAALQACGLEVLIGAVVGGDTLRERKPSPEPLLAAIGALGAAPGRSVMVGDNHNDVGAARAAGVPVVAVTYGYTHGRAEDLDADALIDRFDDLPQALAQIEANLRG